jgi:hypothetical protein
MELPQIFSKREFRRVAIGTAIVIFIFLIINVFKIGGDSFIYNLDNSINAPLAIGITIFAASTWRNLGARKRPRALWGGLIAGWGLWAIAETTWFVASILGREVPYPSLADLFWVLGYIGIGYGLVARVREIPVKPKRWQNAAIWGISAATVVVTVIFIFYPILATFQDQRLIESILNFIYPLTDLFLLVIIWRLFFTFEKGDYGFGWRLLAVGFMFMATADFLFAYTTWEEIYYPNMQANLVSRLFVDTPYTLSYFLWFLGIFALRLLLREPPAAETILPPNRVSIHGHILISTKNDDTIIDASANSYQLFEGEPIVGQPLSKVLSIPESEAWAITEMLRNNGKVADLPVQIRNRAGSLQEIILCGLAVMDPQKEYMGSNLLLCIPVVDESFDDPLSNESRSMAGYILEKSMSKRGREIGRFLMDYHLVYIQSLSRIASHQGGQLMSQSLVDELKETSRAHQWNLRFNLRTVLERNDYPLNVLREALPILVQTAERAAARMTNPEVVKTRMKDIDSQISDVIHRDAKRYLKPGIVT